MHRSKGFIELEIFASILKQIPKEQNLIRLHHFGEAILHPYIDKMIETINHFNLISLISLNPATLSPVLNRKLIAAGINIVCFSLDSFSDEGLFKIRGIKRPFKECWAMLKNFIENSRNSKRPILKIIQMVDLELNKNDRHIFENIKEKYPEDDIYIYLSNNYGFGDIDLVEETLPGGSQFLKNDSMPCGAPFSEVSILWNGDVVLCCYDYDGFNVIGNIKEKTLNKIWNDKKILKIRDIFKSRNTHLLPLCKKCFQAPHNYSDNISFFHKGWEEESTILNILNSISFNGDYRTKNE
ncbi:SPASM domain-containing protein [Desulfobacterales bacterium HSG17]|nr:SPASM domain-containing protein [Desulfobacterales bacterium HSG17]